MVHDGERMQNDMIGYEALNKGYWRRKQKKYYLRKPPSSRL